MGKKRHTKSPDSQPDDTTAYHIPVLLHETIHALQVRPQGTYVDCTFGGGGHARAILAQLGPEGRLVAFDQDAEAQGNLPADSRIIFIPQNFRFLQRMLRSKEIGQVDGLIADLGVSSHQFDEASRGFSTRFDAKLDMRMDRRGVLTAASVIQSYTEQQLHKIFERYGEVTNAKTLARTIVEARAVAPIATIDALKNALRGIVKGNPNKYFAQVFQALRIEVNDELGALEELLRQIPGILKPGARAAIITFHSLEDRLVKNFFRRGTLEAPDENPFVTGSVRKELEVVTKKPISAGEEELKRNPRARSARLRVAEKTNQD